MNASHRYEQKDSAPTARPTAPVAPPTPLTSANRAQTPANVMPLTAPRTTTGRLVKVRERLSERDRSVLGALWRLRLLTAGQVQQLYITDGSEKTRARRTRALLKRLADLGLIVRLSRSVGGTRSGSTGTVWGLSGLGHAVLDVDGFSSKRHRRVWDTKPYFQDHVLAVSSVFVDLAEKARQDVCELLAFDAEPACWRQFTGGNGEPATLKPDAYVRVGVGDFERSAFIEMDMNTESVPTIHRKCGVFVTYWRTGLEQRVQGVFPHVLWLVPDERRRQRIGEVINSLAAEMQALFVVALHHEGPAWLAAPVDRGTA